MIHMEKFLCDAWLECVCVCLWRERECVTLYIMYNGWIHTKYSQAYHQMFLRIRLVGIVCDGFSRCCCSMASKNKWCAEQSYIHNKMKYSEFSRHVQIIFQKKRNNRTEQTSTGTEKKEYKTTPATITSKTGRKSITSQVAVTTAQLEQIKWDEREKKSYPNMMWNERQRRIRITNDTRNGG